MNKRVLVVGAGGMAEAYHKVLDAMRVEFDMVCRSEASADLFLQKTGYRPISGGLDQYLETTVPEYAIIATGIEHLYEATKSLLQKGVQYLLIEKPGALYVEDLQELHELSNSIGSTIFIGYNRRFYSSVTKLLTLVEEDGGVQSISFDFTEWSDSIAPLVKGEGVKEKWVLSNSTHVIDLAFYIAGKPIELTTYVSGGLFWHTSGSCFTGAGVTETNALFSYRSDWDSQGRWGVNVYSKNFSYSLCPLEGLSRISRNSVLSEKVELDDELDLEFKPGLYKQVQAFFDLKTKDLCSLDEHIALFSTYEKIAGY
jgi:predicted dehydrogenase